VINHGNHGPSATRAAELNHCQKQNIIVSPLSGSHFLNLNFKSNYNMKISCVFLATVSAQETVPQRIDTAEPGLFDILIAQKTGLQFTVKI